MSKIDICPACQLESAGGKSRIAIPHTCEKQDIRLGSYKSLIDTEPSGKKCIAPCSERSIRGFCECYPRKKERY